MTDHASSLVSQRLLFGNGNNLTVSRDPVALANRLAQHYKLLDFGPRPGHERSFIHRSFTAVTGELAVTCGYASPIYGVMGERPDTGSVNLIRSGFVSYQCGGNHYSIAPQQPFYFSPSLEYSYASDHYNGVVFDINIPRLLSTAAAMIGRPVLTRGIQVKFSRCQVLSHDDGRVSHLIRTLCNSLLMLDCPATFAKTDLPYLRIDDLVYRCLCLLLLPELYYELPSGDYPILATNRVFDELTEWIIDSLAHPISLTQLEQRSGYSRRTLQKLFQARFACGPIQWVRQQRLERAHQALLAARSDETVSTIARRFGFGSLAVFSREYTRAYGANPSIVLRQARQIF